ncbi:lactose-binding lectin l-2-like [Conger conger]|uniref:lactose-binding lectin l-2-like n=1 Tax=Conger conger TaxID=82655 RepID=UPI002A59CEB9|nr:lactose-binding lectin l-2-like [Conger conger]
MAIFTLSAFLVVAVLSSMTLVSQGAEIGLCQGPCPDGWTYHNHRCFQHIPDKKTWLEAELHCVSLGGNLASERSQDDHQFLKKLNENDKPFWIGLADVHKEGTWLWSDGTCASSEGDFLKWNPGEPNKAGQENCVHSNYGGQADWNDIECDSRFQSVCAMRLNE